MNRPTLPIWLENAREAAVRDPKKACALVALLGVLVFVWVRLLGSGATSPAKAQASLLPAKTDLSLALAFPNAPLAASASHSALSDWLSAPVPPVTRNLFAVKLDYFPVDASKSSKGPNIEQTGFWSQLEKSMSLQADQNSRRDTLITNLKTQAAGLRVQSTVMGAMPKAMINGDLVGQGETVAGFRVIRIEPRMIVVEREGVRLEVPMK